LTAAAVAITMVALHHQIRGNPMAHRNEDLFRDGYAAFGRGDIDALQNWFFDPGIRWHFPGRNPFSGDFTGIGDVLGWLGRSFEATGGTLSIELHDVIGNYEHVVALTTTCAQRDGKTLNDNTVQFYSSSGGRLTAERLPALGTRLSFPPPGTCSSAAPVPLRRRPGCVAARASGLTEGPLL
jgi:uncharacterized protein